MKFSKFIDRLLAMFYPDRCSVCGEVVESGKILCDGCRQTIFPITGPICHKCAAGLEDHDEQKCIPISAPVVAAFYYNKGVKSLIIALKIKKKAEYFKPFAEGFFEVVEKEYAGIDFDIAVCVPSYGGNRNTSSLISREAAKHFGIDFDGEVLEKYRETEKQHLLSMKERYTNLNDSIRVGEGKNDSVKGKIVLICDDVKTTGVTMDKCAAALYEAGAVRVYCACIAVSDYITKK